MKSPKHAAVRPKNRLLTLFNIFTQQSHPQMAIEIQPPERRQIFEDRELMLLRKTTKPDRTNTTTQFGNLQKHLKTTSENISEMIESNESFMTMLPEADKARTIYVSSIMSPVDMCSRTLSVDVDADGLDETKTAEVIELLNTYVNTELALGENLHAWIGDAMYKKGATPVVVIPKAATRELCDNIDTPNANAARPANDVGFEALFDLTPGYLTQSTGATLGVVAGLEDLLDEYKGHELLKNNATATTTLNTTLNSLVKSVSGQITITLDHTKITPAMEAVDNVADAIDKKLKGGNGLHKIAGTTTFTINSRSKLKKNDEPTILRLPTSSVIPVSVPGSPECKLGFFVVVDATGNPINADVPTSREQGAAQTELMKMFQGGGNAMFTDSAVSQRAEIATDVFDILVQHILSDSMKGLGVNGFNILNNSELSVAVFSKALAKNKVSFIFVPASNMAYYAFAFRNDGTGKTLLEDASTLIALRTACIIAKVVSLVDSAKDRRRIEYSLPDSQATNVEQLNGILERLYVDKHMFRPTHNTSTIFRDIAANSLSVVPKEFEGLKDFTISTETTQNQLGRVDNELEDMLTRMITLFFRVPAAAIDDVHEKDFSRSVATSNLLFSNDVKLAQTIACAESEIIVKAALRNSRSMRDKLRELLKDVVATNTATKDNTEEFDGVQVLIDQIIDSLTLTLPSPRVSPDKTQLTELSENMRLIEEVIQAMWSDDLILNDDPKVRASMVAYKQFLKQTRIRELIATSGNKTISDIATYDDTPALDGLREINQVMIHIAGMVDAAKSALTNKPDEGSGY
jgi:hypothetical protein